MVPTYNVRLTVISAHHYIVNLAHSGAPNRLAMPFTLFLSGLTYGSGLRNNRVSWGAVKYFI